MIFSINGCLLFNKVSYEIKLDDTKSGNVTVVVSDINSNAINSTELVEDKKTLFEFLLTSDDFINQMADEGKYFNSRELYVENGKLYGEANYSFEDVTKVEGIVYEPPFYYLT
ncbi:MAG: hypothetical protein R3321_14555, partial [Nitrososphaeraceae archaeon]|nr:hypothetical protein [Nitrososphaeraceae archaeon]